jgi:hypothetical protein
LFFSRTNDIFILGTILLDGYELKFSMWMPIGGSNYEVYFSSHTSSHLLRSLEQIDPFLDASFIVLESRLDKLFNHMYLARIISMRS